MNYQAKKKNTKALIYLMNNELKIGDIVVFRKLVKGELNIFDFDYGE